MTSVVTVVVVTWEGAHLLPPCLDALEAQTMPREAYDVLLVDNASTDGTAELAHERWPSVRVLRNDRNLGFAGGCDTALRLVASPYAVLINNDAVAAPDLLERLVDAAQRARAGHEPVGALTAKILLADRFRVVPSGTAGAVRLADGRCAVAVTGPDGEAVDVVNSTGGEVRSDGRGQDRGWLAVDDAHDYAKDVFAFCGAGALLDMAAVRAAGGFDARYFLYYEDTDLSWRMRLAGYRLGYVPGAVVRHAHASSTGEGSSLHLFHDERNRLLTVVKCAPAGMALRLVLRHLLTTASIARREAPRWTTTGIRLRAWASFLRLLPHACRERRRVGRTAVVTRRDVARALIPPSPGQSYRA